jgi:hypothetical protein
MGENGEMAFMRFTDDHHNIVLFTNTFAKIDQLARASVGS